MDGGKYVLVGRPLCSSEKSLYNEVQKWCCAIYNSSRIRCSLFSYGDPLTT